jgi:hypothetical protein
MDDDFIVPDPSTMGARTRSKAGKDHRGDVDALGIYQRGRLTHGLRRWFISACRNASARREVIELITHNAKGEVIDAYTSWQWSTLCENKQARGRSTPDQARSFATGKTRNTRNNSCFRACFCQ